MAAADGTVGEVDGRPAPVADIPGHGAWMVWIKVVGPHLAVDADRVHDGHGEAEEDADNGRPHAHNEADEFGEQDEEGEHGDADVVVC